MRNWSKYMMPSMVQFILFNIPIHARSVFSNSILYPQYVHKPSIIGLYYELWLQCFLLSFCLSRLETIVNIFPTWWCICWKFHCILCLANSTIICTKHCVLSTFMSVYVHFATTQNSCIYRPCMFFYNLISYKSNHKCSQFSHISNLI